MTGRLRTLLSFSARDWLLFIQAWSLLLIVDIALRTLPFRKVQHWIASAHPMKGANEDQALTAIQRSSLFLDRAARYHLYPMTCLRRALGLHWLLSKQGIHADLHFGVRREQGKLQAHAWLEYKGQPIDARDALPQQYMPLRAKQTTE
jgi:hypothetical protein